MSNLPEVAGATWILDLVKRDKTDLGEVPILVVDDVEEFNQAFPGLALSAINGTSLRVSCQRIGRDMRWEDRTVSAEKIAERILMWARGVRYSAPSVSNISDDALMAELTKRGLI